MSTLEVLGIIGVVVVVIAVVTVALLIFVFKREGGQAQRQMRLPGPPRAELPPEALRHLPRKPEGPSPPARYANVVLTDREGNRPVVAEHGDHAVIEVDIGPLRDASDVDEGSRRPFPVEMLPREDLAIDVLLSSAGLPVGILEPGDQGGTTAEQSLLLPCPGGPSQTEDGTGRLRFVIGLPFGSARVRARLSYIYRDAIVQSQRLDLLALPNQDGALDLHLKAFTDFTLSERLDSGLAEIAPRPRVSVLVNSNSDLKHEVTIRSPSRPDGEAPSAAFQLNDRAVGNIVKDLRRELGRRAPTEFARRPADLIGDLQRLAPFGWSLYQQLEAGARRMIADADPDAVVQVAMPKGSGFTIPWNLVYDIYLDSEARPEEIPVCPLVEELGDGTAAIDSDTRRCPHAEQVPHNENLLCPFGFWGYRHSFELLTSTRSPKSELEIGEEPRLVIAQTRQNVDKKRLAAHVENLRATFQALSPGTVVNEAQTKQEVRRELSSDLPFVYFLCHGTKSGSGPTALGVGVNETIAPGDFEGWVEVVFREDRHQMWTSPRPLVFINACESLAIDPDDLVGYLTAFIGTAQAVGVIGTETRVAQSLAMEVGERFFDRLLRPGASVDDALRRVKLDSLRASNLIGLVYTPYCFADLHVVSPS
jgi:hypothetical protein